MSATARPTPTTAAGRGSNMHMGRRLRVRAGCALDAELLQGILCLSAEAAAHRRRDIAKLLLTTRLRSLPGVTVVQEPSVPTPGLAGRARADLKVDGRQGTQVVAQ